MSEPSSGVVCCNDEGGDSEFSSSSMFVSLPDVSSQQDSAVDVLLPRDHIAVEHSSAYGTISTGAPATCSSDCNDHELRLYMRCCNLSFRALAERLCLSIAIFVVVVLFSLPVAYRFVSVYTLQACIYYSK